MKRICPASDLRSQEPVNRGLALETELKRRGRFDRQSPTHQDIWRLTACQPSATFAQTWKGLDHIALLRECDDQRWVVNFGHIATLFGMTALTDEIVCPSPELIAHLLRTCPQIVDMTLEEFCADGEQNPGLEAALSETSHLRSFDLQPEDVDPSVGLGIVRGLRSHHHLTSWRHWTDDDPGAIVPELAQTLSGMQNLQCLDLCIDASWNAEHFQQIARQFSHMPALQDLRLSMTAGCDLSRFFQALSTAGPAAPLARLKVDIDHASDDASRNIAVALIRGIATLPRLMSLHMSHHVLEAMDPKQLIGAIRRNGAFDTLTSLDAFGRKHPVQFPDDLIAALHTNRNRFDLAPVGMMGPACSALVNVVLAQRQLGPVSDIGLVVAGHLVGQGAAPDLRDCQGLLRASKKVWEATRDMRHQALRQLLKVSPTTPGMAQHRINLARLARDLHILSPEEMPPLVKLHGDWLRQHRSPRQ